MNKGKLGHFIDALKVMPLDRPFLMSELEDVVLLVVRDEPKKITGPLLWRMERSDLLQKVGKGGRQGRYIIWQVTERAKRLMREAPCEDHSSV